MMSRIVELCPHTSQWTKMLVGGGTAILGGHWAQGTKGLLTVDAGSAQAPMAEKRIPVGHCPGAHC